jgi:hypothetical protein
MKKYCAVLAGIVLMAFTGVQASTLSIISNEPEIDGFGIGDYFQSVVNSNHASLQLNGGAETEVGAMGLTGGTSFTHNYSFTNVASDGSLISFLTQNMGLGSSNPLDMKVYDITGGGMTELGSVSVADLSMGSVSVAMAALGDYLIEISGTAAGVAPDYTLEVSAVPVPAAIWLFGTALIGLVGFNKRKAMTA